MMSLPRSNWRLEVYLPGVITIHVAPGDTAEHELDISLYIPSNSRVLILTTHRTVGVGTIRLYPNSHATLYMALSTSALAVLNIDNNILKYKMVTGTDEYDLNIHCILRSTQIRHKDMG